MTRDFTVATFVVCADHVLLLRHKGLQMWLPPGGHIEPNELPDEAAVREVREEAGIDVVLVGRFGLSVAEPRQLIVPRGVQVERISPDHEHIDFVYFGRPVGASLAISAESSGAGQSGAEPKNDIALPTLRGNEESLSVGWYDPECLDRLDLTEEVRMWTDRALSELAQDGNR